MKWITRAIKIALLAVTSIATGATTMNQKPAYLDPETRHRCGFTLSLPATIDSIGCSDDRQSSSAYWAMTINYYVNQFEHNDFARHISVEIVDRSIDNHLDSGANGVLKRNEDTGKAIIGEKLHLSDRLMEGLCAESMRQVQVERITASNWRGYLWRRSARLKRNDLARNCPYGAINEECFLLMIGNTTVTLHVDLICLPRNGKKTDPAEFDADDFMKMIYSLTFDTE